MIEEGADGNDTGGTILAAGIVEGSAEDKKPDCGTTGRGPCKEPMGGTICPMLPGTKGAGTPPEARGHPDELPTDVNDLSDCGPGGTLDTG